MKHQNKFWQIFSCVVLGLLCCAPNGFSQTFKATVVGQVTDSNGAAVPNAAVTITETATNQSQNVTTGDDGNYTIPQLVPGAYTLRVEASNFKTLIQTDVVLETNSTLRLNLTLEVGNISEQITVVAEPPVINSETSDKGEVITPKQVQDLPLSTREYTDLAKLVPGIYQRPTEDDQGQGVSAAGTRTDSTNFILDGQSNRSDRQGAVGVNTSVDSIQEFKVSTSTYSAEFGRLAGAQINVVSKSGTNRYSGTVFEFLRNDAFDARNAFATDIPGTTEDEGAKVLRRNQFGGTFGGPLPFLNFGEGGPVFKNGKDKFFFFGSYERTQETRSVSALSVAPNEAWTRGDFSGLRGSGANTGTCVPGSPVNTTGTNPCNDDTNRVTCISRNPTTGVGTRVECPVLNVIPLTVNPAFPNIVPANATSLQILQRLPRANLAGSLTDYAFATNRSIERNLFSVKVDRKITSNNSLYVRFASDTADNYQPAPLGRISYPGFGRNIVNRQYSAIAGDTHIFNANLINDFRLGYLYQNNGTINQNNDIDYIGQFGIPGLPTGQQASLQGFPAIRIDGFPDTGDSANTPFIYTFKNLQIYDSLTAIVGSHTLKFGVDAVRPNYNEPDIRNVRGDFRFRGRNTNPTGAVGTVFQSFADFLLGVPDSTQRQLGDESATLSGLQYGVFVQDDFRVTSWLTLNLGLRYDYTPYLKEKNDRLSNFVPELGASVCASGEIRNASGGVICLSAEANGIPRSLVRTDKNNLAPRVGFALRPFKDNKTVVRGGAGIFYSVESINPTRQQLAISFPYVTRETYTRSATNLLLLTFQNPFSNGVTTQGVTTPLGVPVDSKTPEIYQYNLTLEREIFKDLAFEIGYVGSSGRFLGGRYDLNAAIRTSTGTLPRPFPAFAEISYQAQVFNSNYNAVQTSIRRRSKNGLTLLASYTFGKALDQNSTTNNSTTGSQRTPQNTQDFRADWGLADFHRTHQFSASFNYDLPFGRGRGFFGDAKGLTQRFFGGWQINGIITALSGRPFTPQYSAGDISQQRPDIIGDPYANIPAGLLFNPAAFRRPVAADGDVYGNAGRNILIGPNFRSLDLSLFKNVTLREKTRLQLRWEVFNVFNRPNFQTPQNLLDAADVGRSRLTSNEAREMQFAIKLIF